MYHCLETTIMKKKEFLWSLLFMVMATLLSAGFSSCGSDDNDNSSNASDEVECWECSGSGECYWCDGVGHKDCRCVEFSNTGKCFGCKGSGRWYNDTCPTCNGSGLCQYCYGTLKETCSECQGNGICEKCGGIGRLSANGDRLSGSGGSGGSGNGSGNGGSDDSDSKRKCAVCLGSGKCEAPNLGYIANNQYCWGNGKCRPCGGTGQRKNVITGAYYACTYCNRKINEHYSDGICGKCGGSGKCKTCGGDGYK